MSIMGRSGPGRQQRIAALQIAAQRDLEQIRNILEDITGLYSRWSNNIIVAPMSTRYWGIKEWTCDIGIREDVLQNLEWRWTTMIHESLHAISIDLTVEALTQHRGWEGVVEQMQRSLRSSIFTRLNITIENTRLQDIDQLNPYNGYIRELERLRGRLDIESDRFYLDLLSTPLNERSQFVRRLGESQLTGNDRRAWLQLFEDAHQVLIKR